MIIDENVGLDYSKVEITKLKNGIGIIATKDIAEGETVYEECTEVFQLLTIADALNPVCDACFLVKKIIQDPQTRKAFDEFGLDSSHVHENKPTKDDKRFLKNLSKKSKVSYDKILGLFRIVCAYNVKVILISPVNQKIRIQLSKLFNRTNHSCNPNTTVLNIFTKEREYDSQLLAVKAIRPIKKGEEVTFSYIDPIITSNFDLNSRRTEIKSLFGFTCNCEKCLEESQHSLLHC
jgi:hypothetical protein